MTTKCIFASTHVVASGGLNALLVGSTPIALVICDFGSALIAASGIGTQKVIFEIVGEVSGQV
jgi:hypothetical protein